jgi:protease-4
MEAMSRDRRAARLVGIAVLAILMSVVGCGHLPITGQFQTASTFQGQTDVAARIAARLDGPVEVHVPQITDPGPVRAVPVRAGSGPGGPRVGLIDVDGLILNQNLSGLYSVGENPVAAFREKLEAAAADGRVRAVVLRINSPGGSVTACDILADELSRFRSATGKPIVCCLMDLGTAGAYYVAVGGNLVFAHPTTITGGIGALINHYNLQDAMAQLNVVTEPIKSAPLLDMGSVTGPLPPEAEELLQGMADRFAARFRDRVRRHRPTMTAEDWAHVEDGRVLPGTDAFERHLVDRLGYLHDAIDEAQRLSGVSGAEVVLFQRQGYPARSLYGITPNTPIQNDLIPFSYPGLDRTSSPTFLYLWEPDPTVLR